MLHNRIASDIRSHFSTVGPSPSRSLDTTVVAAPETSASTGQPAASRLILLPTPPSLPGSDGFSPRTGTPPVFHDLLSASAHRFACFFAEAAVLVLVLGILDRLLAYNRIGLRWTAGVFAVTLVLLAASIATDVSARRWLRAH